MNKLALIILDWFWINEQTLEENAIFQAKNKPHFDKLFWFQKFTRLQASWKSVWIIDWFMWWSEVWHLTIWSWKIIKQNILKINEKLYNSDFQEIYEYKEMIDYLEKTKNNLHITWMLGFEWVHSYQPHLYWLLKIIPKDIKVFLHIITDWRDSPIRASYEYLKQLLDFIKNFENVKVSSISWRYFSMDRDNNWERIEKTYKAIIWENQTKLSPLEILEKNYKNWKYDEFIEPTSFSGSENLKKDDVFLHYNFRSDRWTQLVKYIENQFWWDHIFTMTKFYDDFKWKYFIKKEEIQNTLSDILSKNWFTQLHIAETEKFAHVTKFFNWLRTTKWNNEEFILVPSHKIEWLYDKDPEMSAFEIFDVFKNEIDKYDFFVINFANWDLVGHAWVLEASIKAVETLDKIIWNIIKLCDKNNIDLLITSDHWNCEKMWTKDNPCNSHTTNLVPFWYIKNSEIIKTKESWWLANITPTILDILWIDKQKDMLESLLIK